MARKGLGNNPLFNEPVKEEPVFTEEDIATIRAATSDIDDYTTMSFRVRKTYLKKIRDYAYTERLEIKEALDYLLKDALSRINDADLLESPERPKIKRPRKG